MRGYENKSIKNVDFKSETRIIKTGFIQYEENVMTICLAAFFSLIFVSKAWANPACAVCTLAVGASLELARQLGVDDCVVGVWAGALLALLGYWLVLWFDKKGWNFYGRNFLLIALSVAMIGFTYVSDMTYTPRPILVFYLDPFLFSVILGALVLVYSSVFYQWMKKKNGGHAHFPFEKVVVPVLALTLLSVYFNYYPISGAAPLADASALYSF